MGKSNRGRKSKYETHVKPNLSIIESWREKGLSEEIIANKLNIAYSSLSLYKVKYKELSEVLSKCKEKLGAKLKKTLYQEANGYVFEEAHVETEVEPKYKKDGTYYEEIIKIKRKTIKRKHRPQPSLLMFALCNLLPDEFKRIDKDVIDNLGEELEKRIFSSEKIQKAFSLLYDDGSKKRSKANG